MFEATQILIWGKFVETQEIERVLKKQRELLIQKETTYI